MTSTTFTLRVEADVKKRLEKLARSTGRSRSFLAAEALSEYLDVNEWQVAGIRKALGSLRAYIAEDNPAAAKRVVRHIIQNVEQLLRDNPQIGRAGRVPGTRELVVSKTPYLVPYRVRRTTIQVLRVYHGARRWPDSF